MLSGKRPCNQQKNRDSFIIPADSSRVKLTMKGAREGTDYINASYIDVGLLLFFLIYCIHFFVTFLPSSLLYYLLVVSRCFFLSICSEASRYVYSFLSSFLFSIVLALYFLELPSKECIHYYSVAVA